MTATYPNDLSSSESLVTLKAADEHLSRTLHGREWTARVNRLLSEDEDDPDSTIDMTAARPIDMAALRDASSMLARLIWRPGKTRPATVPDDIQVATSLLAAHLVQRASLPVDTAIISFQRIGEASASFRAPSRDDLPRHVRTLVENHLEGSATWSPVRP